MKAAPFRECQWIEATPRPDDQCKCLMPVEPGSPYCPTHAAKACQRREGGAYPGGGSNPETGSPEDRYGNRALASLAPIQKKSGA